MPFSRRLFLAVALCSAAPALGCGGPSTTLHTVRSPTGSGDIDFEVQNNADVALNSLFMAKAATLRAASGQHLEPGSQEEIKVWGSDLLEKDALRTGARIKIPVEEAGVWDVRVLDRDNRYQFITGLKLGPGGTYVLEVGDAWHVEH
jgi:hypothetical protein